MIRVKALLMPNAIKPSATEREPPRRINYGNVLKPLSPAVP